MLEDIIKELSDDNHVAYIKGLDEKAQNVDTLTTEVNDLENESNTFKNKAQDAIESRDKVKTLIKNELGITEISGESLREIANNKGTKGDEKLLAEIENYKSQMESISNDHKSKESEYISQIRDLKLGSTLSDLVNSSNIIDDKTARADAMNIVKSQLSYDDNNNPVFKNEDGTTKFNSNGQAYTIQDGINDLISSRPYLAKPTTESGAGTQGNQQPQTPPVNQVAQDAKQKGDLNGFLSASIQK
jgi:hypothetical protein